MPMPNSTRNTSMFLERDWKNDDWTMYCQAVYNTTPKWDWAFETFGGKNYTNDFKGHSNIMFSNGKIDPWSAGGVKGWINYKV